MIVENNSKLLMNSIVASISSILSWISSSSEDQEDVNNKKVESIIANRIKLDLQTVIEQTKKEFDRFENYQLSDREKSKRILFHFQKDLIAGLSGQTLDSQDRRDEISQQPYSQTMKQCCWALLITMNLGMLFYIFLFGISRDGHHQAAWAKSFAIWLGMEIFLISTIMVIVMNVLMPMILMKDIKQIKMKLIDTIIQYNRKLQENIEKKNNIDRYYESIEIEQPIEGIDNNNKSNVFNAAEYLFVSYRLAKAYPELRVAKIILAYETIWPRQSYLHVSQAVTKTYSRKFAAIYQAITILLTYFLTNFLTIPIHLQDMIIQIMTTVMMGYTILIHLQLYHIYPILIVVPTIILAAIVHFFVRSSSAQNKIEIMSLLHYEKKQGEQLLVKETRQTAVSEGEGKSDDVKQAVVVPTRIAIGGRPTILTPTTLPTGRRASLQHGMGLLQQGRNQLQTASEESHEEDDEEHEENLHDPLFDYDEEDDDFFDRFDGLFHVEEDDIDVDIEEILSRKEIVTDERDDDDVAWGKLVEAVVVESNIEQLLKSNSDENIQIDSSVSNNQVENNATFEELFSGDIDGESNEGIEVLEEDDVNNDAAMEVRTENSRVSRPNSSDSKNGIVDGEDHIDQSRIEETISEVV